jgi:hypothetical protein
MGARFGCANEFPAAVIGRMASKKDRPDGGEATPERDPPAVAFLGGVLLANCVIDRSPDSAQFIDGGTLFRRERGAPNRPVLDPQREGELTEGLERASLRPRPLGSWIESRPLHGWIKVRPERSV